MEIYIHVIDGDNMSLLRTISTNKKKLAPVYSREISQLMSQGFKDVSIDIDGDIVCYREE